MKEYYKLGQVVEFEGYTGVVISVHPTWISKDGWIHYEADTIEFSEQDEDPTPYNTYIVCHNEELYFSC